MNSKTSKLIRKFASATGIDWRKDKTIYRQMKKAHNNAPLPEKVRGTKLMRDTLAAE